MKKYRTVPATILLIAGLIMILSGNIPRYFPIIFLALSLILYIWTSRGSMYFAKANKIMQKDGRENIEKSRPYYEKAYKAGVPLNYELYIGIVMVQYFDYEQGGEILKRLSENRNQKIAFQALDSLSMYYWIKKDYKEAISTAEKAKEMNLKDRNLYINLCTYYLAAGDERKFRLTLKEAYRNKLESVALLDLEAVLQIIDGNYMRAGGFLKSLFEIKEPRFIDPYVHEAMVYMHYGEADKAISILNKGLANCYFSNTSVLDQEGIRKMIGILENAETKHSFMKAAEEEKLNLINGIIPEAKECADSNVYPPLPDFISENIKKEDINEKDEGDIDTSLTDEDEEWLKKHNS